MVLGITPSTKFVYSLNAADFCGVWLLSDGLISGFLKGLFSASL